MSNGFLAFEDVAFLLEMLIMQFSVDILLGHMPTHPRRNSSLVTKFTIKMHCPTSDI